jgi:5'/3'-nucleotidase SurE
MRTSKFISLVAMAGTALAATSAFAIDIALSNDDGWNATGIQVMREALVAAGHHVTLAAPLSDQSGAAWALDLEPLQVKKQADGQYSVALARDATLSAKPGTSALVAIGIVQESGHSPDLLISGINSSPNLGMQTMLSGTVGAAAHSVASVMNGPVPAIAIGTEEPSCDAACKRAHYQVVADFVVRLVAHLEKKPGFLASQPTLLPSNVALIISYPVSDTVAGVKVAQHSNAVVLAGQRFTGAYMCGSGGCSGIAVNATKSARIYPAADPTPEVKNADVGYFLDGYVTIVPISPDVNITNTLVFKSALEGFTP